MRKDMWRVKLVVDGKSLVDSWDVMTGGESDTAELTYKPGGMQPPVSLGGSITIGQIVVSRLYDQPRDDSQLHWLLSRVGKGHVKITKTALDVNGNTWGHALVYNGTLKRVTPPEVDSTSTDAATIEMEITPAGSVPA
jgi:hypothetical protein